jgi:prevent-host-death family protein
MVTLSFTAARQGFAEAINRSAYGKERIVVKRREKPLVAIIPIEDLRLLEALEDAADARDAAAALAAFKRSGAKAIPLAEAEKRLAARKK